ncbi:hypothetical protein BJ508DRAFT_344864 [Ascobolus immersus RN42]|uniref:CFEM domain-containing protein n=1 Tax=Ascobolus immersus RN42 TaxID=1160509 RepID=A0A3N4IRX7_ASCIM|nr:hypothetical protein BJ508DRAFT_344864 [Ascobolus immersus RN42]
MQISVIAKALFGAAAVASMVSSVAARVPARDGRVIMPHCFAPCTDNSEMLTKCGQEDNACRCADNIYQAGIVQCFHSVCENEAEYGIAVELAFSNCDGFGMGTHFRNRAAFRGRLRKLPGFGRVSSASISIPVSTSSTEVGNIATSIDQGEDIATITTMIGEGDTVTATLSDSVTITSVMGTPAVTSTVYGTVTVTLPGEAVSTTTAEVADPVTTTIWEDCEDEMSSTGNATMVTVTSTVFHTTTISVVVDIKPTSDAMIPSTSEIITTGTPTNDKPITTDGAIVVGTITMPILEEGPYTGTHVYVGIGTNINGTLIIDYAATPTPSKVTGN